MRFSGKTCLKIILKVTKKKGFTLSLEDKFFEKPQKEGDQFDPPGNFRVNGKLHFLCNDGLARAARRCAEGWWGLGWGQKCPPP